MLALLSLLLLGLTPTDSTDAHIAQAKRVVFEYVAPHDRTPDSRLWRFAWVDVNGDGLEDVLAYAEDEDWCGPDGCTLLVIEAVPEEDQEELGAYMVAAEIADVRGPVTVQPASTDAWCDLVLESGSGQYVTLQFNGETYPYSPAGGVASGAGIGTTLFAIAD